MIKEIRNRTEAAWECLPFLWRSVLFAVYDLTLSVWLVSVGACIYFDYLHKKPMLWPLALVASVLCVCLTFRNLAWFRVVKLQKDCIATLTSNNKKLLGFLFRSANSKGMNMADAAVEPQHVVCKVKVAFQEPDDLSKMN
jgi:hypothetical protein